MNAYHVSELIIYPVKSLAGISVKHWQVTPTGLYMDRKWMLIDDAGQFMSQRRLPAMALIHTAIHDNCLVLSASGMTELTLPLSLSEGTRLTTTVWHDQCEAIHFSSAADEWLSTVLQHHCRLVYHPDDSHRAVDPLYSHATDQTAFSDGFPFLIISENSLHALNHALTEPVSMRRFRPNLVISGCPAYAEDSWREIRIGTIDFRLPKACSRCSVPALDPDTALLTKEPLATLNRLRKWQNKLYFGQNALHNQCGDLHVGDAVIVNTTGAMQPPL